MRTIAQRLSSFEFLQSYLGLVYLCIATPAILLLVFLTQPLHAVDEPSHFLRVMQISDGDVLPVLGPDGRSTGSLQTEGVKQFVYFWGKNQRVFGHTWSKTSLDELHALYAIRSQGSKSFIEHSNTTIYFPLPYIAPVATTTIARQLTDRPLIWLYAGRLGNAILSVILYYIGIRVFNRGRLFAFVIALLPISLFQSANLSADSLLLPSALILAGMAGKLLDGIRPTIPFCSGAVVAGAAVGLGKLAYLPLISVLPVADYITRQTWDRHFSLLVVGTVLLGLCGACWDILINGLVFTSVQGSLRYSIDVGRQIELVRAEPSIFIHALVRTFDVNTIWLYLRSISGGVIGWIDIPLPVVAVIANAIILSITSIYDTRNAGGRSLFGAYVAILSAICSLLIFFLIYAQWNPVGAFKIDGFQGRYLLPFLPFLTVALPKRLAPDSYLRFASISFLIWCACSTGLTLLLTVRRYWGLP